MRKLCLLLLLGILPGRAFLSDACTNLIVGKAASADGSVICTYNCDTFGETGWLTYSPAGAHAPGEKIAIRSFWHPDGIRGYVDQVPYTYQVVGYMNEKQLTILETTFGGREELVDPEGILDYDNVMQLALQRCATAREAIVEMGTKINSSITGVTGTKGKTTTCFYLKQILDAFNESSGELIAASGLLSLYLAEHLTNDNFDVLIVDINTL